MAGGFLRSPRVRVMWGNQNLSSYPGDGAFPNGNPLVYDVEVDLQSENDGPKASMKWDPTGPGMAVYESFISNEEFMKTQITIEFFYPRGKKILFVFVWSGQSISYGNDMTITVKMTSELSGLINANIRSTAQAYDEKKGGAVLDAYKQAQKQFGLEKFDKLVQFNQFSLDYAKKAKIASAYGTDWTFGNNVANFAKQTGDAAFAHNIGQAGVVIFPPFSFKEKENSPQEAVLNGATDIPYGQLPDPTKRYGYILGPSIIKSITRESNWKPPQQDNSKTPASQTFARTPATAANSVQTPAQNAQATLANPSAAAASTSSPQGTSSNRASLNVQNKDNPLAQVRQNALNDEKAATLSVDTLMCPVLVGIKPYDIIYVPSLTGQYIEDWIVQSVGYTQNNGEVNVSIQATRLIGQGTPMNKEAAKVFETFAQTRGLIGPNATLEAWDKYAWDLLTTTPGASTTANPALPSPSTSVLAAQAQELRDMQAASRRRQGL